MSEAEYQKCILMMQDVGCDMTRARYYLDKNSWNLSAAIVDYWRK